MANELAVKKIGLVLSCMRSEAAKRCAPVLYVEAKTKGDPFKILVFTMLSARTKDETTLKVVERLFQVAKTPKAIAALGQKQIEKLIYGVGFYRVKARNLIHTCNMLDVMGGEIPDNLEDLLKLPGVGRKTANIVLARAFGKSALGVDVHVHRISNRLGLVKTKKPEETEIKLLRIVPKKHVRMLNRVFVAFGQTVCLPRKPLCFECPVNSVCKKVGVMF
jgi:endonuclease-3